MKASSATSADIDHLFGRKPIWLSSPVTRDWRAPTEDEIAQLRAQGIRGLNSQDWGLSLNAPTGGTLDAQTVILARLTWANGVRSADGHREIRVHPRVGHLRLDEDAHVRRKMTKGEVAQLKSLRAAPGASIRWMVVRDPDAAECKILRGDQLVCRVPCLQIGEDGDAASRQRTAFAALPASVRAPCAPMF